MEKHEKWFATTGLVLGVLWLVSGLNKIISESYLENFGALAGSQNWFLRDIVVGNSELFAYMILWGEFSVGFLLILTAITHFIGHSRTAHIVGMLASLASMGLALSIIISFQLPLPWINPDNALTQGISLEYIVVFLSFFQALANASEM